MLSSFQAMTSDFSKTVEYFFSYSHLYTLIVSIIIFSLFVFFKNMVAKYIFSFFINRYDKTDANNEQYLLQAFQSPLQHLLVLIGAYLALKNYLPDSYDVFLNNLLGSGVVILMGGGLYESISIYVNDEAKINRLFNKKVDKILIPFFSKMLKFIIIALAFVVIASRWGFDVNGFVAGLGLGGLAFALAAKDLLANIFSGIILITDKPFNIGDWIQTSDIEGTVQDINFRSTKIKKFDNSLVIVPNSSLANAPITNFTKRTMRRITFNLKVKYDTSSEKLKQCVDKIQKLLVEHPRIDKETIAVKFDSFDNSALNIFIYFFTTTIVWDEYLNIKQDINFQIMGILEDEQVKMAFPSTSVYVETPAKINNEKNLEMKLNTKEESY